MKTTSSILVALAWLPALLSGQGVTTVRGTILDSRNVPVKGVIIDLWDYRETTQPASTNGDGYFEIRVESSLGINTKDDLRLYCRHPRFPAQFLENVRIDESGLIRNALTLRSKLAASDTAQTPKPGKLTSIAGLVVDADGMPMAGAVVKLVKYIGKVKVAVSDANGIIDFDVKGVDISPAEKQTLIFTKPGLVSLQLDGVQLDSSGLIVYPFPIVYGCTPGAVCDDGDPQTTFDRYDKNCGCAGKVRSVNWRADYIRQQKLLGFGLLGNIGFRPGHQIALDITPSSIRLGQPHPDDVSNIPGDILGPNIPDNYLIEANKTVFSVPNRFGIDLFHVSVKGLLSVAVRVSTGMKTSPGVDSVNLHRLDYILPDRGFSAFIYYSNGIKESAVAVSIPVYATLPVFTFGKNRDNTVRAIVGTDLLPPVIRLQSIKGWDRYGERTPYQRIDVGKIRETHWYAGFDIARPTFQYGFQAALVKNVLKAGQAYEAFKLESRLHPSLWFKLAFTFKNKKS